MAIDQELGARADFALVGGRLDRALGPSLDDAVLVVRDGRIAAIGDAADTHVPDGLTVIDVTGKVVLPGFVDGHTHLGIVEEGEGWAGVDTVELSDPNGARLRALDAINPADLGFDDALRGGVSTVVVTPGSADPIGGQSVALKCWGATIDDMVVKAPCTVKSALGENPKRAYGDRKLLPSSRMGIAAVLRDAFRAAARADDDGDETNAILRLVLDGTLPLAQHCHRADDIRTAIRLADEFGYRPVINHGTEAHFVTRDLAERDIPVFTGPILCSRGKVEMRHLTPANPGLLHAAGIRIALITDAPAVPIQALMIQAALAVKEGLDRDEALRAVTVNPSTILGLSDRVGSLAPGADADVAIWSGDPLDTYSRCEHLWIEGRLVFTDGHVKGGRVADRFAVQPA